MQPVSDSFLIGRTLCRIDGRQRRGHDAGQSRIEAQGCSSAAGDLRHISKVGHMLSRRGIPVRGSQAASTGIHDENVPWINRISRNALRTAVESHPAHPFGLSVGTSITISRCPPRRCWKARTWRHRWKLAGTPTAAVGPAGVHLVGSVPSPDDGDIRSAPPPQTAQEPFNGRLHNRPRAGLDPGLHVRLQQPGGSSPWSKSLAWEVL